MSRTSEKRARRANARRQQAPQGLLQNRKLWIYGGIGIVVLIILVVAFNVLSNSQPAAAISPTPAGTPNGTPVAVGTEVAVPQLAGVHVNPGEPHAPYNSTPPTSGPHFPSPAPWGRSDVPLPEEEWIHNLEHGGIVALYNCPQGCSDLVNQLSNWLKIGPQSKYGYMKMLIVPYTKISNKLTFVAWGYYLPLNDWNDAAIRKFFSDHQDKGPEDIG